MTSLLTGPKNSNTNKQTYTCDPQVEKGHSFHNMGSYERPLKTEVDEGKCRGMTVTGYDISTVS